MVSYSTNWMGPISMRWFRDRGLVTKVTKWSEFFNKWVEYEEITQSWSCGRIDVYGDGIYPDEISLPLMLSKDWNRFSRWLDNYKTESVETFDQIIESYYKAGNPPITWWIENG